MKVYYMASKRMFDLDLVNTDAFMDLSPQSFKLYFYLNMYADDEGFIQPKRIMRLLASQPEFLEELVTSGFVLQLSDDVVAITHWHKNNWLDKRRVKDTIYMKQKDEVSLNDIDVYIRLADAKPLLRENRIEESSIEEYRIEESRVEENRINIDNINFSLKNFKPSNFEEFRIVEISRALGEKEFPYLIQIYKKYGYTPIEQSWLIFRDLKDSNIDNKGAYFNKLVTNYLGKQERKSDAK